MKEFVDICYKIYRDYQTIKRHQFTGDKEIDKYLIDLKNYSHLFVLSCLMDRGIKAEKAWVIPYYVCKYFNKWSIEELITITEEEYISYFETYKPHRYNHDMAIAFYKAVHKIKNDYNGNAYLIWSDNPSSATVVYRFLEFYGAGIKIATMAVNILSREFEVPLSDYYSIDISPDVHVKRVFGRMGFVKEFNNEKLIIYKAREINPTFPGMMDVGCWDIGKNYCHPKNPDCHKCPLKEICGYKK